MSEKLAAMGVPAILLREAGGLLLSIYLQIAHYGFRTRAIRHMVTLDESSHRPTGE